MSTIRPMIPADYPSVANLADDAAQRALLVLPTWESAADVAREIAQQKQAEFLVAEDDAGRVLGFAGYALQPSGEAQIYGPVVLEEGHGTGAYLAGRVEALAAHAGARSFEMYIGLSNRSGAAWAEWRGYLRDLEDPELLYLWVYPDQLVNGQAPVGKVRAAATDDLAAMYAVYQASLPTGQQSTADWERWLSCCTVLESDGKIIGVMRLDRQNARVRTLCVDPARRREGAGAQLLTESLRRFWADHPVKVSMAVRRENAAAIGLMRRLGFTREVPVAKYAKREG